MKDNARFKTFLAKAKSGDRESMYTVAKYYESGLDGVPKNISLAMKWYEKAALKGMVEAKNDLGAHYMNVGNIAEGTKWLKKAADQGHTLSQCNYAMYLDQEEKYSEAFPYFEKASDAGDERAKLKVAYYYYFGFGTEKDVPKSIRMVEELKNAKRKFIRANVLFLLGGFYIEGNEIICPDVERGIDYMRQAADLGQPAAVANMAIYYYGGDYSDYIEQDYDKAFTYADKAASLGMVEIYPLLGDCYYHGRGTPINIPKAIECYSKAYENGNMEVCNTLGYIYYSGIGVDRDYGLAIKYWEEAASKEYPISMYYLGVLRVHESEDPAIISQGEELLEKAGKAGIQVAYIELGNLYYSGDVLTKNDKKAFSCYKAAEEEEEALYMLGHFYHFNIYVEKEHAQIKEKDRLLIARDYYSKAKEKGFDCGFAIDSVDILLGSKSASSSMNKYAVSLLKNKNTGIKLTDQIKRDLMTDCGESWNGMTEKTHSFLVSGIFAYTVFLEMGEDNYKLLDFTSAISPLCKALEVELCRIFFTGFIDYLKHINADPNSYIAARLAEKPDRSETASYYDGHTNQGIKHFSLGSLSFIFKKHPSAHFEPNIQFDGMPITYKAKKKKYDWFLDENLLSYFDLITKDSVFPKNTRHDVIVDYLFELAEDVSQIAKQYRNPANHHAVMSVRDAELCGDYILKLKGILIKFVDKIDYRKLEQIAH